MKMPVVLLKQLKCNFNKKNKMFFHVGSDKMFLKSVQKDKRQKIANIFLQMKNKLVRLDPPETKTYYKAVLIKRVQYWYKDGQILEQNGDLVIALHLLYGISWYCRSWRLEKRNFSINGKHNNYIYVCMWERN